MLALLRSQNIDVNIKHQFGEKAIDMCKENAMNLKTLLQIGPLRPEDAGDHVTRLLDRGVNLEKENDSKGALANYNVANLLLKEFGGGTEESMRQLLRCLECLEHVHQVAGNEQEAREYSRGVANTKRELAN